MQIRTLRILLCFDVLVTAAVPARADSTTKHPEMIYFVMLDRFANGDPSNDKGGLIGAPGVTGFEPANPGFYHGGDIQGLIKKIPYIKSLGFTAIWVTPVVRQQTMSVDGNSTAYHGYWGVGFDQVDPHLGTMADFKEFVTQAHSQSMKVILDIVVNHTADVIHYLQGGDYVGLSDKPYKTINGRNFDALKLAGSRAFPALDQLSALSSFPKTPIIDPGKENIKSPAWLNDPRNYHNRGNVGQSEESRQYGDFFGLDDLFTESPVVVTGWISVFSDWIKNTGIDGFRIDTARHVNTAFWQRFLPAMRKVALSQGKSYFPMWGEIYDTDPRNTSHWIKAGAYNEVLDFPMQAIMVNYINQQDASLLGTYFNNDDFYTTATTDSSRLGTFLDNHDMGRIGSFITARTSNPDVALKRDQLAHALLFTIRGVPMLYYGDEFGLTGGGDKEARQDLFPTAVASWADQFRIGSDPIGTKSSFDTTNPIQETIRTVTALRDKYPALSSGSQRTNFADNGVFVFSRFDPKSHRELLVGFNSNGSTSSAAFPQNSTNQSWKLVAGSATTSVVAGKVTLVLPALSWSVFEPANEVGKAAKIVAKLISVQHDPFDSDQLELAATATGASFVNVQFLYRIGVGSWNSLGTDDAPTFSFNPKEAGFYRVYPLVAQFPKKKAIQFKAVVTDSYGITSTSAIKILSLK
jgi:alpha-amylase